MTTETLERPVAKRSDTPVRIDNEVLEECRLAAAGLKKSLSEYISDVLRPIAKGDNDRLAAERLRRNEAMPKGKAPKGK